MHISTGIKNINPLIEISRICTHQHSIIICWKVPNNFFICINQIIKRVLWTGFFISKLVNRCFRCDCRFAFRFCDGCWSCGWFIGHNRLAFSSSGWSFCRLRKCMINDYYFCIVVEFRIAAKRCFSVNFDFFHLSVFFQPSGSQVVKHFCLNTSKSGFLKGWDNLFIVFSSQFTWRNAHTYFTGRILWFAVDAYRNNNNKSDHQRSNRPPIFFKKRHVLLTLYPLFFLFSFLFFCFSGDLFICKIKSRLHGSCLYDIDGINMLNCRMLNIVITNGFTYDERCITRFTNSRLLLRVNFNRCSTLGTNSRSHLNAITVITHEFFLLYNFEPFWMLKKGFLSKLYSQMDGNKGSLKTFMLLIFYLLNN